MSGGWLFYFHCLYFDNAQGSDAPFAGSSVSLQNSSVTSRAKVPRVSSGGSCLGDLTRAPAPVSAKFRQKHDRGSVCVERAMGLKQRS